MRLPRRSMPTPVRPDADGVAEREAPLRAVVQRGVEASVPDDREQALAGPCDVRPRVRAPAPLHDRDAAVAIADDRGVAVLERLVHAAVVSRAVPSIRV